MGNRITEAIYPHGVRFAIDTAVPLTEIHQEGLTRAFEEYSPRQLRVLSSGRPGEKPLRIIVAPKEKWGTFTHSPIFKVAFFISSPPGFRDTLAMYNGHSNELFVNSDNFAADIAVLKSFHHEIKHETAHAIDDFAVTRFCNDGMLFLECGSASETFAQHFDYQPAISFASVLGSYGFVDGPEEVVQRKSEFFAAAIAFLTDATLSEEKKNSLVVASEMHDKCVNDNGEWALCGQGVEGVRSYLKGVKYFLANYPSISGVQIKHETRSDVFSVW